MTIVQDMPGGAMLRGRPTAVTLSVIGAVLGGAIIVETIFDSVIRALQGGDKIEIRGFGSFRIRQRNPRIGRNPKTGERVEVPAKRVPYFKPSKELRDLVNPEEAAKPS